MIGDEAQNHTRGSISPAADPASLTSVVLRALEAHGQGKFIVTSNSMARLIRTGDEIHVTLPGADEYQAGQVFVYRDRAGLVVHRLIDIQETAVIFQGDASPWADPPQERMSIVARVVSITHGNSTVDLTCPRVRLVFSVLASVLKVQRKLAAVVGIDRLKPVKNQKTGRMVFQLFRIPISGLIFLLDAWIWIIAGRRVMQAPLDGKYK